MLNVITYNDIMELNTTLDNEYLLYNVKSPNLDLKQVIFYLEKEGERGVERERQREREIDRDRASRES